MFIVPYSKTNKNYAGKILYLKETLDKKDPYQADLWKSRFFLIYSNNKYFMKERRKQLQYGKDKNEK